MERPKLKNFDTGTLSSLNKHQIALIEWSWWAEDRIKELEDKISVHGAVEWIKIEKDGPRPYYNTAILIKDSNGMVRIGVFSDWDDRFYNNVKREKDLTDVAQYYTNVSVL